ncbi:MAG: mechanosensitive ion channel family protein [Pseudomonadota bacterium]
MAQSVKSFKTASKKLLWPLLICVGIFVFFYFGEDNQAFGLAAMDSTRKALKYVLGVIAFLALAILAQRVIRYVIFDGLVARATGAPVPKLLTQISGLMIYSVALAACAGIIFNQDLTVVWAASGVAGLVLGMALKELLQDVFAGIALNVDRAVRIGDYVQLHRAGDGVITGQLLEISWRTTQIKDLSQDVVVLPNSKFSAYTITNFSRPKSTGTRRFSVTLDAAVPQTRAIRILQAAALEVLIGFLGPDGTPPKVKVKIREIKLDGVEYVISFDLEWQKLTQLRTLVFQNVLTHLGHAGIEPARSAKIIQTDSQAAATTHFGLPDGDRLVALIGKADLFRNLGKTDLCRLAKGARLRVELPDRVVVQAGEAGSVLYLVLEGLLMASAARSRDSRPTLPPLLRPGDLFDASTLLLGDAHLSTVRTRTPVLLCEFDHVLLQQLFQASCLAFKRVAHQLAIQYTPNPVNRKEIEIGMSQDNTVDDRVDDIRRQMRHIFPGAAFPCPDLTPPSSEMG